jgi:hypothetical protein
MILSYLTRFALPTETLYKSSMAANAKAYIGKLGRKLER